MSQVDQALGYPVILFVCDMPMDLALRQHYTRLDFALRQSGDLLLFVLFLRVFLFCLGGVLDGRAGTMREDEVFLLFDGGWWRPGAPLLVEVAGDGLGAGNRVAVFGWCVLPVAPNSVVLPRIVPVIATFFTQSFTTLWSSTERNQVSIV